MSLFFTGPAWSSTHKSAWKKCRPRQKKHLRINLPKERSLLFTGLSWIHVISRSLSPRSVAATNQRSRSCRPGRRDCDGKERETAWWLHICLAMGAHTYTPELIRRHVKARSSKPCDARWSHAWKKNNAPLGGLIIKIGTIVKMRGQQTTQGGASTTQPGLYDVATFIFSLQLWWDGGDGMKTPVTLSCCNG